MIRIVIFGLLLMGVWACSSEKSSESKAREGGTGNYELVKVDSFEIENLTRVNILDYDPSNRLFLAYSEVENDILEVSKMGEIIKRVNRMGEGPNNYGSWVPVGLSFGPDNTRILQMPFFLYQYDADYNLIIGKRITSPLPIRTNTPLGRTPILTRDDTALYVVGPQLFLSAHFMILTEEGRDTLKHFNVLDLNTGRQESVIPFEKEIYHPANNHLFFTLMAKSFFVEDNKLVYLSNLDKQIRIIDPERDFKEIETVTLKHSEFKQYPPLPMGSDIGTPGYTQLQHMAGRNLGIITAGGGIWLVKYYQGLSENEFDARRVDNERYGFNDATDKIKLIVIENKKQVGAELTPPPGKIILGLGNGTILVQEPPNPEVEEEVTRYSIYRIKRN